MLSQCTLLLLLIAEIFGCTHPFIPDSLDTYSYLGTNNQFHVANYYRANFTISEEYTSFTLSEQSLFRVYASFQDVEVSLQLFKGNFETAVSITKQIQIIF